jgi:predicted nucleic acid-binding protein
MIVIADTGPLNYLVQIDCVYVLPKLYGNVTATTDVMQELMDPQAPEQVRRWASTPPSWLRTVNIQPLPSLSHLDLGEASALAYASSLRTQGESPLVLIDEIKGRRAAEAMGLAVRGTLGVLDAAGVQGLIRTSDALARLRTTSFHAQHQIFEAFLDRARSREV